MKKWIITLVTHYWPMISILLVLQTGYGVLMALQPLYFQQIVSLVFRESGSKLLADGIPVLTLLAVIYLTGALLQGIGGYIGCIFSSRLLKQLQVDFFEKVNDLPIGFFQTQSAGEIFTKFNNDIGKTQNFLASVLPSVIRESIIVIAVVGLLLYFCPVALTLATLVIVAITATMVFLLNHIMVKYAKAQRAEWGEINRVFDETVQGIDTLKTFAAEKQRAEQFQTHTADFRKLSARAGSITAVFSPGMSLISKFGGLALICIAYFLISKGSINIDPFLLFFFYSGLLMSSVYSLINHLKNLQFQVVGIRNLASFFSEPIEEDEIGVLSKRIDRSLPIEFKDIDFAYRENRVLYKDANLFIPANSITLIHGPSGSGKSTLINLLLRFYSPHNGSIRIGGVDINRYTRHELRKKVGVVTQYHFIFHETLRDNLRVAKSDASDKKIIQALEHAHLKEFLYRLPKGLDQVLWPGGKGISAGERQRICIARLLLKNSYFMIFDEPWSNLDQYARNFLAEVINDFRNTTTILVLTHEDMPLLKVDKTYKIIPEKGKFVETKKRRHPAFRTEVLINEYM